MRAEFDYELSKDEYVIGLALLMEQLRRGDKSRSRMLWEQIAAVVGIVLVVTIFFPNARIALDIAALAIFFVTSILWRRWSKASTGISYDPSVASVHLELGDAAIIERRATGERRWSWGAVRQVHDAGQAIVFELAGWNMLVLPARLWADEDERRGFMASLPEDLAPTQPWHAHQQLAVRQGFYDMVRIAALAAAVDVLGITVSAGARFASATGARAALAIMIASILLGGALAYAAYRFFRSALPHLRQASPIAATFATAGLILAFPIYTIAAYLEYLFSD